MNGPAVPAAAVRPVRPPCRRARRPWAGVSHALPLAMAYSTAERAAEQRRVKLEEMQQLINAGSLTVRKMTPAERERYPPRPPKPRKSRWS